MSKIDEDTKEFGNQWTETPTDNTGVTNYLMGLAQFDVGTLFLGRRCKPRGERIAYTDLPYGVQKELHMLEVSYSDENLELCIEDVRKLPTDNRDFQTFVVTGLVRSGSTQERIYFECDTEYESVKQIRESRNKKEKRYEYVDTTNSIHCERLVSDHLESKIQEDTLSVPSSQSIEIYRLCSPQNVRETTFGPNGSTITYAQGEASCTPTLTVRAKAGEYTCSRIVFRIQDQEVRCFFPNDKNQEVPDAREQASAATIEQHEEECLKDFFRLFQFIEVEYRIWHSTPNNEETPQGVLEKLYRYHWYIMNTIIPVLASARQNNITAEESVIFSPYSEYHSNFLSFFEKWKSQLGDTTFDGEERVAILKTMVAELRESGVKWQDAHEVIRLVEVGDTFVPTETPADAIKWVSTNNPNEHHMIVKVDRHGYRFKDREIYPYCGPIITVAGYDPSLIDD